MTRAAGSLANPDRTVAASDLRLRFREPVSLVGYLDAAWWPHSRDLATELAPVLAQLAGEGRRVARVIYDLNYWTPSKRRLMADGHLVRLGGFSTADPRHVSFIEASGRGRIDVMVIDPETTAAVAERIMESVARAGNLSGAAELLESAQHAG